MGCSNLPANRECGHVERSLRSIDSIRSAEVACEPRGVFAGNKVGASIEFSDGAYLKLERLGFDAFGSTAVNVVVAEASGLIPRLASCDGIGSPNFHRDSPLGHHFHPTLIDAKDAVFRYREVLEEVEYWPQCPQYWEVQDRRGENYRYCARRAGSKDEPPKPSGC